MTAPFSLVVRTPAGVVVDAPVRAVVAEDGSGRFGLQPGVEPLVAALVPTVLEYRDLEGQTHWLAVGRGALVATREYVVVTTRDAVPCASLEGVRESLLQAAQQDRASTREARRVFRAVYRRLYSALIAEERAR